jgi:OmpA-OmpF porin, OOP family
MHRALASLTVASLLIAAPAAAQTGGFALDRFDPSERGSEWFAQDTLDLRGNLRPAIGVVGSWAYKPLVAYRADGEELAPIVRHQLVIHPGASLVVADRLRFAFNLPVALYQDGEPASLMIKGNQFNFTPAKNAALGDLRLSADVRLLGRYGEPFTLALGAAFFVPTGKREEYTGDGKVRVTPRLLAAGDIGAFAYAARIGVVYRALNEPFGGSRVGTELTFGASAGIRALDRKLLIGPEVFGSTVVVEDQAFNRAATPLEVILGAHYTAGDFRIGLGGGPGLTRGFGSPVARALLSLEWAPAYEEPKVEKHIEPPPPPKDTDSDGIIDEKDACPTVAGVASEDPAKNGCPSDKDGDGIIDSEDACPEVKGIKSEDPKKNGCPPDKDNDGIIDDVDACPDVAGVKTDDPKTNGCPPDKDGDGIIDPEDACPDTPGPKNADPKKNGCPAVAVVGTQIKILEQVKFKTGSAEILKESDEILSAVAKILKDHPEIKKVRVEGHTDNVGKKAMNKDLSKKRAASVVTWLVKKGGLDAKRFESNGFGDENPIDTNDTDAGRQNNRRVEFHIVGDTKIEEKK